MGPQNCLVGKQIGLDAISIQSHQQVFSAKQTFNGL